MATRDTLIPVCKVVHVLSGTTGTIPLANTAIQITDMTVRDNLHNGTTAGASGLATVGARTYTISGDGAGEGLIRAGSVVIKTREGAPIEANVIDGGAYTSLNNNFGLVDNQNDGADGFSVDVSFSSTTPRVTVPYVTVTDLSGATGFFRVAAGTSGTANNSGGLYANPASGLSLVPTNPLAIDGDLGDKNVFGHLSGVAGTIGAAGTTVTLTLPEEVDSVVIQNMTEATTSGCFALNYGVIKQANVLGDREKSDVV